MGLVQGLANGISAGMAFVQELTNGISAFLTKPVEPVYSVDDMKQTKSNTTSPSWPKQPHCPLPCRHTSGQIRRGKWMSLLRSTRDKPQWSVPADMTELR